MSSSKNSLANKAQAWSARFAEPVDELVQRYTASIGFDQRFALVDIAGSLAHAQMLAAQIGRAHVLNSSHIPLSRMPSSA